MSCDVDIKYTLDFVVFFVGRTDNVTGIETRSDRSFSNLPVSLFGLYKYEVFINMSLRH